jgi:hypothetical protein
LRVLEKGYALTIRFLRVLTVIACLALFSNPVKAEVYFGARLEILLIIPVLGVQLGYDFGDASQDRFGIRGGFESLVFINRATLDGTFRFANSSIYVGGGLGLTLAPFSTGALAELFPEYHVLIGSQFKVADSTSLFIEGQVGLTTHTAISAFAQFASLAAGFNWHF